MFAAWMWHTMFVPYGMSRFLAYHQEVFEMYVPTLCSILDTIGSSRSEFENNKDVVVPAALFRLLLQLAVAGSDFNEEGYIKSNPDIADALKDRSVESAMLHYVSHGYFEGRFGATPDVDEDWYLRTYPDVRLGVKSGKVKSAADHFNVIGAAEGRAPTPQYRDEALQWKAALSTEPSSRT